MILATLRRISVRAQAREIGMKKLLLILLIFLLSSPSYSTVKSGKCPEEFIGKLKIKLEVFNSENKFDVNQLVFTNIETIEGEIDEEVILETLKFGPFKFEEERVYRIQMRKGKLCWVDELN